jgi:hypothetical protein
MDDHAPGEQTLRRQLTAFAQFTTNSLGERNIDSLLMDACLRSRAGLNVTHAKLMEYLPDRDRLLLRAGASARTLAIVAAPGCPACAATRAKRWSCHPTSR